MLELDQLSLRGCDFYQRIDKCKTLKRSKTLTDARHLSDCCYKYCLKIDQWRYVTIMISAEGSISLHPLSHCILVNIHVLR